jgi:hypothetical protein
VLEKQRNKRAVVHIPKQTFFSVLTVKDNFKIKILTSFPTALQLRVNFGLLNNQPPFFDAMVDGCPGKRHFPLPVLPRPSIWFLNNLRVVFTV